jgi:hypothetical protein
LEFGTRPPHFLRREIGVGFDETAKSIEGARSGELDTFLIANKKKADPGHFLDAMRSTDLPVFATTDTGKCHVVK